MPIQSEFGSSDLENVVADAVMKTVEYKQSDMVSNVFTVPVLPGTIVLGVGHEVKTAFSGGSTPTVTIGDGTNASLFATSAEITPGTINTFAMKMAPKKVTATLQTVTTGLRTIPTPAKKLVVRVLKGDNITYTDAITVTGTDASSEVQTETFDFSIGPSAGQRVDGLDSNPSDSVVGYEALVGSKEFASVTSVAIPAMAGIGSDVINITVGFEDAVGTTHDFEMDSANPTMVPWVGSRKYIPPGNDGIGLGETYQDCKIAGMTMSYPNDGIISARVDVLGRKFNLERNPTWASGIVYEDYESVPIGSVIGSYLRTPFFGEQKLSVVGATVAWQNAPWIHETKRYMWLMAKGEQTD